MRAQIKRRPAANERRCACGCGQRFVPRSYHHRYISERHQQADWARKHPRVGVAK